VDGGGAGNDLSYSTEDSSAGRQENHLVEVGGGGSRGFQGESVRASRNPERVEEASGLSS